MLRTGLAIPTDGFLEVFGNALAIVGHPAEPTLRIAIALIGGKAKPADGFLVVFGNAFAPNVHRAKSGLRIGITLLGKRPDARYLQCVVNGLASSKNQRG